MRFATIRTMFAVGASLFALAIAAGCNSPPQRDDSCSVDEDCGTNWICTAGVCEPGYRGDFDGMAGTSGAGAGGGGGASGVGGASGTGGAAGTGGAGGTSGGSGTGGTGGTGGVTDDNAFDITQLWVVGHITGYIDQGAIGRIDQPDTPRVSLGWHFDEPYQDAGNMFLRPSDGHVVYLDNQTDEVKEFNCDFPCNWFANAAPPSNPNDDDPVISTPYCDTRQGVDGFRMAPDTEEIFVRCVLYDGWYNELDQQVYDGSYTLDFVGANGQALSLHDTFPDNGLFLVDMNAGGTETEIDSLPQQTFLTARPIAAGGFHVLMRSAGATLSANELWLVDSAGDATLVDTYADAPVNYTMSTFQSFIDEDQTLYQFGTNQSSGLQVVIRRPFVGQSTVVFAEDPGNIQLEIGSRAQILSIP